MSLGIDYQKTRERVDHGDTYTRAVQTVRFAKAFADITAADVQALGTVDNGEVIFAVGGNGKHGIISVQNTGTDAAPNYILLKYTRAVQTVRFAKAFASITAADVQGLGTVDVGELIFAIGNDNKYGIISVQNTGTDAAPVYILLALTQAAAT